MSLPSSATLRTSFVGRDAELASLRSLILRPATRLVTVTGVGGVGKTRLVNELHSHLDGQFAGGIWFVPVAHVREPEQVLAAVATRVGIRDLDADETIRRVVERFDGQPSLLMLDNLEQVIECGTIIARLLHAAPALTILATSRQPLHLLGEVEFPVRPLPVKASADSEPPAETLFIARARESSYRFVVTDDNRKAIASITQRLGGLPLAIELAASWVKVLPPQRLLENLDRQLDVLVRGRRDLPERQQTMRSAIAWSYALLSESERALFRQLSVFAGPFTLGDVERVATVPLTPNRSEFPELLLLETLSSLVTKSLVQALDDPIDPAEPEYSMLEIIRSFGAEQLASHGDELVLRKRHLDHFTAMSARWSEALSTPKRDVRLAQFDREYPNLHAALDWAVLSGNRTAGLRLVAALWVYWDWRGFHAEGARWSDAVLALGGESDPALLAKALYAGSAIAFMQANYARSMELAEACLAAAEASGDEQAIARGLVALGNSTYDLGQLDRSNDIYTRALAMSRAGKNEQALQVSLVNLGYVSYQLARFDAAAELFREAIALESGTGRSAAASWARVGAAQTHHQLGELDAAEAELRDIIEMQRSADTGQLAAALTALSAVLRALGRHADAEPLIREAVANRVERDERALLTDSLGELAAVALAAGAELDGVTLASAVASQRDRIGYGLPDRERLAQIATVESLRSRLDKDDFGRAWERGARMTIVEAVAFANQLELSGSEPVGRESEALAVLTPREREVVCLIIEGRTDREIAAALSITAGTASRHVANILHKLDVPNRSAAAAWAIRNGLT